MSNQHPPASVVTMTTADDRQRTRALFSSTAQILAVSEAVGAELPPALRKTFDEAERIRSASQQMTTGDDGLLNAVIAVLEGGGDPAKDPEVLRIVAARDVSSPDMVVSIEIAMANRIGTALRGNVDAVVEGWRKPFDTAAKALVDFRARVGDVPLDATDEILGHGGDIAAAWTAARDGLRTIEQIVGAWTLLASAVGSANNRPKRFWPLRIATVGSTPWHELPEGLGFKSNAYDLLLAGLDLNLATPDEFVRRATAAAIVPDPDPEPEGPKPVRMFSRGAGVAA